VPVPDFQSLMRPLLAALEDGHDRTVAELRDRLADHFSLTEVELNELLPSGRVKRFQNRTGWAVEYLYRTGLIERAKRAVYRITDRGRKVLADNRERVDLKVLSQFPELAEFREGKASDEGRAEVELVSRGDDETPEERIDSAYRELRSALAAELLDQVIDQSAAFFEQLVLDVLHAMGYGGTRDDAAEHLGQSGDEGVDGVIREDRLGLDLIYVQAKKWEDTVGRPEIQKFVGALQGQRASKGVFITTSRFSRDAGEFAQSVTPRVILIDGKELAQLMIEHGVGVSGLRMYELKRLDLDYFVTEDEAVSAATMAPEAPAARADAAVPVKPGG
jgi:restriction system protein